MNQLQVISESSPPQEPPPSSAPTFPYVRFLIDGRDLRSYVGESLTGGRVGPPIGVALLPSRHLLGSPDANMSAEGRPALLVCRIDADMYCGAVTADVQLSGERITWSDFRDVWYDFEAAAWRGRQLAAGPFVFDEVQYRIALTTTT
jgi:hypothetical protein